MPCSICDKEFPDKDLTEIGGGSKTYQCETCWNNYGEEV
jgi:DNA-directed RNA polymerase subunit RPC12/RpoP